MAGVSRWWAGWDSAWEQEKPKARRMPENRAESHQSAAPGEDGWAIVFFNPQGAALLQVYSEAAGTQAVQIAK